MFQTCKFRAVQAILLILVNCSLDLTSSEIVGRPFDELNKYLRENIKSEDIVENLSAAVAHLSEQAKHSNRAELSSAIDDLSVLVGLKDDNICSYRVYSSISDLINLSYRSFVLRYPNAVGHMERLDKVLNQIRFRRAKACYAQYESQYDEIVKKFGGQSMETVDKLLDKLLADGDKEALEDMIVEEAMSGSKDFIEPYLISTLNETTGTELDKVEQERYERRILRPCNEYLSAMGPLERQEAFDRQSLSVKEPEFVEKESIRYLVCEYLINLKF